MGQRRVNWVGRKNGGKNVLNMGKQSGSRGRGNIGAIKGSFFRQRNFGVDRADRKIVRADALASFSTGNRSSLRLGRSCQGGRFSPENIANWANRVAI
jgi:hypothetical protein